MAPSSIPAQRRAVGLVETFKRGITAHPDQAGAQPLVLATVDLGLLTRQAERRALRDVDLALDDLETDGAASDERERAAPPHRRKEADSQGDKERELTATRVATLVRQRCVHRGERPPPAWRPDPRLRRTDLDRPSAPPDPFDLAGLTLVPAPDPTDPFDLGTCDIPGTGPVPVEMARRLACNGRLARVVLGADRTVLDMGRAVRLATPDQRRALVARDRGCVFPGCDRGPLWCEAHHLDFFIEDEGPTDLANLALVCRHHHHLVHERNWTLRRTRTGWVATSPTDRRLHRAVAT